MPTENNARFDTAVISALKKAGWYEGRKLDITEKVKRLEALGYEVFEQAKLFLEEFDDLKILQEAPYYDNDEEYPRYNSFNVSWFIKALENMPQERRQRTTERRFSAPRADEKTIPIGELSDGYMYLFITESGRIITDITIEGNSIEEGITNLVQNNGVGHFLGNSYTV